MYVFNTWTWRLSNSHHGILEVSSVGCHRLAAQQQLLHVENCCCWAWQLSCRLLLWGRKNWIRSIFEIAGFKQQLSVKSGNAQMMHC